MVNEINNRIEAEEKEKGIKYLINERPVELADPKKS